MNIVNRTTRSLRLKIVALRQKSPPQKYRVICVILGILKENGEPDTGMAQQIEKGYKPRLKKTRERLGLIPASQAFLKWRDLPDRDIQYIFEHREEVEKE